MAYIEISHRGTLGSGYILAYPLSYSKSQPSLVATGCQDDTISLRSKVSDKHVSLENSSSATWRLQSEGFKTWKSNSHIHGCRLFCGAFKLSKVFLFHLKICERKKLLELLFFVGLRVVSYFFHFGEYAYFLTLSIFFRWLLIIHLKLVHGSLMLKDAKGKKWRDWDADPFL